VKLQYLGIFMLVLGVTGCIRVYTPSKEGKQDSTKKHVAKAEEEVLDFSNQQSKLGKAKSAFDQQSWQEATRLASEVRKELREHKFPRNTKQKPTVYKELYFAATAIEGLAQQAAVDEFAALFVYDKEGLVPETCTSSYRELCDKLEAIAHKEEYKALFEKVQQGPVSGMAKRVSTARVSSNYYYVAIPGMAGYSEASVGYFLNEHVIAKLRKNKRKYGAVWVRNHFEAKLTTQVANKTVRYHWKGESKNITSTSCNGNIVGKLKVGSRTYDIERCKKGTSHSPGGAVTMSLSKNDAENVDFEAGDSALVVFETSQVSGSGYSLSLGTVRLVRVEHHKRKHKK
jgi:hypothetical protein